MLSKEECRRNFAVNCEKIRYERDISQQKMAEILGISRVAYRKMIENTTQTISAYTAYRLCLYSGIPVSALFGDATEELYMLHKFENMTKQQRRFIKGIVDFESEFYTESKKKGKIPREITVMTPNGDMLDGFEYDTCTYDKVDIGNDFEKYKDAVFCGIRLPNNCYSPTYVKGDLLLIGNDRQPRNNEIGIFINKNTGRAYLRKLNAYDKPALEPVCSIGKPIDISGVEIENWIKLGYVIKKIRNI